MADSTRPIRVAINDDYEIVVTGTAAALAPYADRIEVVELDSNEPTVSDVDIVLYDTFGQDQGPDIDVGSLSRTGEPKVVVFTWNVQRELVDGAISAGAAGYLWKGMPAHDMVAALERIHAGTTVTPSDDVRPSLDVGAWPGQEFGLSAREAEVVALLTQGLTNQEIADKVYLSINSVKTYLRTAYRKMGVSRRSQAVAWGLNHGLAPDHVRTFRTG
ncbi:MULTISPECIES: response regulator transcription factor [unclassified Nocardioides]|uniref:response regulator transcription factor n=1 Tax=unclassified Nocardioides TaxID=2615069 RepID=UPI0009F11CD8|nr:MULTISPECIES: response regulator transcription factor [unclassified Nocardioides]GAW51534.1 Regulatory protein, LuxR [Nocardioides sp. PD653-B2]GAW56091.1 Regulatory protein, LuxR [Nocardioides sp. PD653]